MDSPNHRMRSDTFIAGKNSCLTQLLLLISVLLNNNTEVLRIFKDSDSSCHTHIENVSNLGGVKISGYFNIFHLCIGSSCTTKEIVSFISE